MTIAGGVMVQRISWAVVSSALIASNVLAADAVGSLLVLPVDSMKPVAAAEFRKASALAARGGAPLDIAMAVVGAFEGSTQHILQVNEGSEAPTASRVTVLRDGLLDDSVRGERWDIALERTAAGAWSIKEVKRAWRCWRGEQTERYAATRCP
jgi:hypothetical protein